MPRLMSVALTEAAVVARQKTVTRRLGWTFLKPGDRLTLVRKAMGRKHRDGTLEPLVRLAEVVVVSTYQERLADMDFDDIEREGVPDSFLGPFLDGADSTVDAWVAWFCHHMKCGPADYVNRIEWLYLDAPA